MSDSLETPQGRPWHLWVVGILYFLWCGMAAFDFIMTVTKNEAYLAGFSEEILGYYYSFPVWMFVLWAVGGFGGAIGALLLLLRKGVAVQFLAASLVAGMITTIYTYAFTGGLEVTGMAGLVTTLVFLVVAVLVLVYTRRMKKKGVLV
jgi:hypothetical protein